MRATAKGFAVGRPDSLNTGNVEKKARTFFDGDNRLENIGVFHPSVSAALGQSDLADEIGSVVDDDEEEDSSRDTLTSPAGFNM
jgi:hypothetical protein